MTAAQMTVAAVPDGMLPLVSDPRVIAAAELLAEGIQPAALSASQLRGLLARYDRRLRAMLDVVGAAPTVRERIHRLQALEDAIRYRHVRAGGSCAGCDTAPEGRCEDHGRDLDLIAEYQQSARSLGAR